jgi:hypothetical protein
VYLVPNDILRILENKMLIPKIDSSIYQSPQESPGSEVSVLTPAPEEDPYLADSSFNFLKTNVVPSSWRQA